MHRKTAYILRTNQPRRTHARQFCVIPFLLKPAVCPGVLILGYRPLARNILPLQRVLKLWRHYPVRAPQIVKLKTLVKDIKSLFHQNHNMSSQ